jgi:hypothetical protein
MTLTDSGGATAPTMGGACNAMLLRLAGRVPDGLLAQARAWLAEREPDKVAHAVASWAVGARLVLTEDDVDLLRWIFETVGLETSALEGIATSEDETAVEHAFAPAAPEVMVTRGDEFGPCLDLTGAGDFGLVGALADDVDRSSASAAASVAGAVALWRAWRSPADGSPWPVPRRVFLLAVADAEMAWAAAGALQDALVSLGEREPQVEAFGLDSALPAYQRAVRSMSALLWTAAPAAPIRLAPVYDAAPAGSEDGGSAPFFAPDRPQLADIDRVVVADLLDRGTLLMATTARLDDVLAADPATGRGRVPVNFRTDGVWVWNDAIAYYVREHGIAPVAGLLEHLRSGPVGRPDAVGLFRGTAALTRGQ